ncbi:GAF domain-containing sensor histidine kinase [Streptosporangium sandarakinum]|uniref:GAF domain-containing sensor histidine kinase n=1 Tax=Streptosporangium sandarakinum TaxID=1260955 RepID=UPI003417CCA1
MRLDELLAELQVRLEAVLATRDRMQALLNAVVSVGSDLDLETVLRRIVETAATLVDARYGALGVVGEENTLVQFLPVGLSEEEIARIEHWPHGLGLLGLLIKDPCPVRLANIADHSESYGFPPGHPPMGSFLGVPIRIREEVFGNLYLTEKRGGGEFDEEDEAIVVALATAAGVAIENARLYEESRRREVWLQASSDVTTALLSGAEPTEVLTLIAGRARRMAGADAVAVLLPDDDGRRLRVVIAEGPGTATGVPDVPDASDAAEGGRDAPDASGPAGGQDASGAPDGCGDRDASGAPDRCGGRAGGRLCPRVGASTLVSGSLAGQAFASGEPFMVTDPVGGSLPGRADPAAPGPAAAVPIGAAGTVRGVLWLAKRPGRIPFSQVELRTLHAFAGQAAIALELAESRIHAERLGLLEDRDRIAKDLHDVVIQRLFAVAMTLMSAVPLIERPQAATRVQNAIDELDSTIRQIRSTIFALQSPDGGDTGGLRGRITTLVEDAGAHLGFRPALIMDGPLDNGVPPEIGDHLLAVLREALSNVVRHAKATRVGVHAGLAGDRLTLLVEDDGVGIPADGRCSGLRNLRERADRLGGAFHVDAPPGGGTRLSWSVPLG